jgi:predicted transglutaminase-like cysteine proteinase
LLASCVATIFLALPPVAAATAFNDGLFGYSESVQPDSGAFAQWTQVLERRLLAFLDTLRARPPGEQIAAVNRYANRKRYVLDLDNYGVEDYWAIPREFLYNNGDCEDYAITKLFSLRWLGFGTDRLRIVVLQDTNLRIPHAVLAVDTRNDIVILDNQIQEVVSQHDIVHYSPVYAINEQHWWLYLPELD